MRSRGTRGGALEITLKYSFTRLWVEAIVLLELLVPEHREQLLMYLERTIRDSKRETMRQSRITHWYA